MTIRTIHINEGEPLEFTERIQHRDGTDVVLADVASITLKVFDDSKGRGHTAVFTFENISPLTTVFDTLQLDGLWDRDTEGYNFKHAFRYFDSEDAFSAGGRVYRMEYRIDYVDDRGFQLLEGRVAVKGFRRNDRYV